MNIISINLSFYRFYKRNNICHIIGYNISYKHTVSTHPKRVLTTEFQMYKYKEAWK